MPEAEQGLWKVSLLLLYELSKKHFDPVALGIASEGRKTSMIIDSYKD